MAIASTSQNLGLTVAPLLTLGVRKLVYYVGIDTEMARCIDDLPQRVKDRLLQLMSKRGLVTDDNIKYFLHARVAQLDFSECDDISDLALTHLSKCQMIMKIDLNSSKQNRTTIRTAGLRSIAQNCPYLQTLFLRRCTSVTNMGLIEIAQRCPYLVEINLDGCVKITDAVLASFGRRCHHLRSIDFSRTKVTDAGVINLVSGPCAATLIEIRMSRCLQLTGEAIEVVANSCPRMAVFVFYGCPNISEEARASIEQVGRSNLNLRQLTWTVY